MKLRHYVTALLCCLVAACNTGPPNWHVIRGRVKGTEYYMVRVCNIAGCSILGYRYPVTPEGLQDAQALADSFSDPDPVVLEIIP